MSPQCTIGKRVGARRVHERRCCEVDDHELFLLLFRAGEDTTKANMPEFVRKAFMSAAMTALQKPDGGVRGIVQGTSFRRLGENVGLPIREGS